MKAFFANIYRFRTESSAKKIKTFYWEKVLVSIFAAGLDDQFVKICVPLSAMMGQSDTG